MPIERAAATSPDPQYEVFFSNYHRRYRFDLEVLSWRGTPWWNGRMKLVSISGSLLARKLKRSLRQRFQSEALLYDIEIGEFIQQAVAFEQDLWSVLAPVPFDRYPYDSMGTLSLLDRLLTGPTRYLRTLVGTEPVLDVGCGDGLLSFVFEALGAGVYAIDNPRTNYNGMRGVRTLKQALRSSVRIQSMDLDGPFQFPVPRAGLALFFGTLYHLKNPFGVLESLGRSARYCLLSTAITRFAPDQKTDLRDMPAACLANRDGLKGDETNYWIFTEEGLRVLADRTGWEVCDWMRMSDGDSTLWGSQRDERVFCLLRSRAFAPLSRTQLLHGWHHLENNAWRWTERRFSIHAQRWGSLTLRCTLPESLPVPVNLTCGEHVRRLASHGDHEVRFPVPSGVVNFEVDRCLRPDSEDARERALIVRGLEIR